MTLEDVTQAKQALEAEGVYPSQAAILARLGHGSTRDVGRFMRQLAASGGVALVARGAPEVFTPGVSPSGVESAEAIPPVHV